MSQSNHQRLFEFVSQLPTKADPWIQELDPFTLKMLGTFDRKSPTRTNLFAQNSRRMAIKPVGETRQ